MAAARAATRGEEETSSKSRKSAVEKRMRMKPSSTTPEAKGSAPESCAIAAVTTSRPGKYGLTVSSGLG